MKNTVLLIKRQVQTSQLKPFGEMHLGIQGMSNRTEL